MAAYSPRLLISCVGENTPPYHQKILTLYKTIKAFGGELANEKLIANFAGPVKNGVRAALREMGVEVRTIEPFDSRSPHCNKIRMLEIEEDYDVLIALDCDTVVVRDFSTEINPAFFQAKPVNNDPLTISQWENLFSYFHLECPRKRVETTGVKQLVTIPYFNSGVLAIPKQYVRRLRAAWGKYAVLLMDNYHKMGEISKRKYFTDQHALALALTAENIPYKEFPVEMNFSTPLKIKPKFLPNKMHPYILHYHKYVLNNGLLMKTKFNYTVPNSYIRKVNRLLERRE